MRKWVNHKKVYATGSRYIVTFLILFLFAWFNSFDLLSKLTLSGRQSLCVADLLIDNYTSFFNNALIFAIILLNILLSIKGEFRYDNLILYGARRRLLFKQVRGGLIQAGIYSSAFFLSSLFLGYRDCSAQINWENEESYFFKANKVVLDMNFVMACVIILLSLFMMWAVVAVGYILLSWLTSSVVFQWILMFLVKFFLSRLGIPVFVSLVYRSWIEASILPNVVASFIALVMLMLVSFYCAKRRQFYGRKDDR